MGKNVRKNLSDKYSQKLFDNDEQSATDALKTSSKKIIKTTTESTGDLISNKISNRI